MGSPKSSSLIICYDVELKYQIVCRLSTLANVDGNMDSMFMSVADPSALAVVLELSL